jgi:hypothetical protein
MQHKYSIISDIPDGNFVKVNKIKGFGHGAFYKFIICYFSLLGFIRCYKPKSIDFIDFI